MTRPFEPIAIIGAACRFPGDAANPDAYWSLLERAVDAVGPVPPERWDVDAYFDPDPDAPGRAFVRDGSFLRDVAGFDAAFFGIAPREAASLDPQHRLLLELAWESLEDAAIAPDRVRGTATGVYVGVCFDDYARRTLHADPAHIDAYAALGSSRGIAAGRVAYVLGLTGPALQVDTTCSSSLLATHLACQGLQLGDCDVALAGGVNLILAPEPFIGFSKLRALSRDGRCRTFDASADGFGRGEGGGIVVLRRLDDAIAAGDRIVAVIRGTAANHDGRSNGLTAPNGQAQEAVIRRALDRAGVAPEAVQYVEAHGTGTRLGDPIELRALGRVLDAPNRARPCLVGSVKSNFGHLEAAAGVASLLKVALALDHATVPPQVHFRTPNPLIPWAELPIEIPTTAVPWPEPASGHGRVAGVSAFGMSGTNVHVVLAPAPPRDPVPTASSTRPWHLLPLSARSETALVALALAFAEWLDRTPAVDLASLCATAATGRAAFEERLVVVGRDCTELRDGLHAAAKGDPAPAVVRGRVDPEACTPIGFVSSTTESSGDTADDRVRLPSPTASTDLWEKFVLQLARLYVRGADVDWTSYYDGPRRPPLALPTYPFDRRRHWIESRPGRAPRVPDVRPVEDQPVTEPEAATDRMSYARSRIAEALETTPDAIDDDRPLGELGLDSLMSIELVDAFKLDLGIEVPPEAVDPAITIRELVSTWLSGGDSEPAPPTATDRTSRAVADVNPQTDARLDDAIRPASLPPSVTVTDTREHVLLTGATGYLGTFLLETLLHETDACVHCLVRASDCEAATARIGAARARYGLGPEWDHDRVVAAAGDVARPRLGLHADVHARWVAQVGEVYHSAAKLGYVDPYGSLRAGNVLGTREALRFACAVRPKSFHHVSSTAVFEGSACRGTSVDERTSPETCDGMELGYSQTKWAAEQLVQQAGARGLAVSIHRAGFITGLEATNTWNTDGFLCRLARAVAELRCAPGDLDLALDVAPIDFVSRAIVYLARRKSGPEPSVWHLTSKEPVRFDDLVEQLSARVGSIDRLPYDRWLERLSEARGHSLEPLLPFLSRRRGDDGRRFVVAFAADRPLIESTATHLALERGGISCPAIGTWLEGLPTA